jgi:HD-GYP domain-containing protein (c-di-GMP phosphodiesterase class II)
LKNWLQKLEAKAGQYLGDHSFLTGHIACAISSEMEWNSEATFHKLTLASFMHDITLNDNALAECETIEEAEKLNLKPEALYGFKKHPFKTAEMVRGMTEIPPDVDSIIFQHHERPSGEGFPRSITGAYISPLSAVFIVAHDMAKTMLREKDHFDLKRYLEYLNAKWTHNSFKKILAAAGKLNLNPPE